jgi:hypothetical protein
MRKQQQIYDLEIPYDDDYKMTDVMERDRANYESQKIWFYLGADDMNPGFAKIGITMGDLSTRSYSSANPNYFIFCAFQCRYDTKVEQLKIIERDAKSYLDSVFCWEDGQTKRVRHRESQQLSECYYNINFEDFFVELHEYLIDNHYRYFQTMSYGFSEDIDEGYALAWEFNPILPAHVQRRFLRMILRG